MDFLKQKKHLIDMKEFETFEEKVNLLQNQINDILEGKIEPANDFKSQNEELTTKFETKPKILRSINKVETEQSEMSKEAFMRSVEEDANRRYQQKVERERNLAEAKKLAVKAFRLADYSTALFHYNKAVEIDNRNSSLYADRAVTYLKLGLFSKAIADCDEALKLKKHPVLKPLLLKSRALWQQGFDMEANQTLEQAKRNFPERIKDIQEYSSAWSMDMDE